MSYHRIIIMGKKIMIPLSIILLLNEVKLNHFLVYQLIFNFYQIRNNRITS